MLLLRGLGAVLSQEIGDVGGLPIWKWKSGDAIPILFASAYLLLKFVAVIICENL
jgi:hypothetical protein